MLLRFYLNVFYIYGKDYLEYIKFRNAAKSDDRRSLRNHERDIAAMQEPKKIHGKCILQVHEW